MIEERKARCFPLEKSQPSNPKKKHPIRRGIFLVLLLYVIYLLVSLLLPPSFWQESAEENSLTWSSPARVRCIDDNEEALEWRLRLIDLAEEELELTTFDFHDDNSGQDVMAALVEAADRGVHIRLLVDGISGFLQLERSESFCALASMDGVEVKFYNPVNLLTPWVMNYRMHDKYLIVDESCYLLGGRNTYDLFLGNYVDPYNIDRDILVYETETENTSLSQLSDYFETIWALEESQAFSPKDSQKLQSVRETLREHGIQLTEQYPEAYAEINWEEETLPAEGISLLSNSPAVGNKEPKLWSALTALMAEGEDVEIQTPYIICNKAMYQGLTRLGENTSLRIMTNGVEIGANPFGCTDYLNEKGNILATGAQVVEWMGNQSLHTKTVLVDDELSIVGSYNLDMRSTYLDTELMLAIRSEELNKQLREQFDRMAQESRQVEPDGTVTLGPDCQVPEQSGLQKVIYSVLRVVLRPIRHIL
jgi:phosphatidylserine/phosphatidylglycerophosphate/cardiolipin synthase-like enzyme